MMDIFNMLQNAPVYDAETGELVGQSVGFEVSDGRLHINAIIFSAIEGEDPDGGSEVDVPQSSPVLKFSAVKR